MRRRVRKKRQKKFHNFWLLIFLISFFMFGLGYAMLSQEIEMTGTANINIAGESDLQFEYSLTTWTQGSWIYYQYNITVTNIGNETVDSWAFSTGVPDDLRSLSCWNGICTHENETLHVENESWNGTIEPGQSQTNIGVEFRTQDDNYVIDPDPEDPEDPEDPSDPELAENIVVEAVLDEAWQSGNRRYAQYDVYVTNENEVAISWWEFYMTKPSQGQGGDMDNMWNANYVDEGGYFHISNASWNGTIESDASVNFGFIISMHQNDSWTPAFSEIEVGG